MIMIGMYERSQQSVVANIKVLSLHPYGEPEGNHEIPQSG
jgi:hypothetical protein